ncbi:MAG: AMP-binding protein [Bacteroidales bacterium]|nr:AMP-binding protein [Bacteroidales bacterium]
MNTLIDLFESCVAKYSNNVFLLEKRNNKYMGTTYKEVKELVYKFGAGLMSMGIEKGDRIAILSEGRNDWVISELGILYTGAVNIPLSVKLAEPAEIKFRLNHSGAKIAIVSKNQLKKIRPVKNDLPSLEKIIILDSVDQPENNEILFSDVMAEGAKYLELNRAQFDARYRSVADGDYANICYTSGTTADPKGIILTHRNYTANITQSLSLFNIPEWWTTLLILPWDHAFAHTCGIYTLMSCGASMAAIHVGESPMETLKNIPVNIREIRPTFLMSVPSLAKNFKKNIEKGIREKGPVVEKLFNFAIKLAYTYNGIGWNRGKGLKIFLKPLCKLFDKILFTKVREGFGGRLEFFIGGGALLDIELQRFFYAIGMPMYQGYGLTEAAPVISANNPKAHKMGSSGQIVKDLEIKICDEDGNSLPIGEKGEIVVKGENVMAGYWKNEEATNDTIKNGWLFTGDLGYLDKDRFLYVLGRFKSLLIADDGEKFSPEGIEEAMTEHSAFIDHCMLYNNQKPYTIALINPNKEAIKRWAQQNNIELSTQAGKELILKHIESEVNQFRTGGKLDEMFPQRWLPAAIGILKEGFTEENQMMNSTLKMVRGKITYTYTGLIDYLYTPEAKNICNQRNIKSIEELLG